MRTDLIILFIMVLAIAVALLAVALLPWPWATREDTDDETADVHDRTVAMEPGQDTDTVVALPLPGLHDEAAAVEPSDWHRWSGPSQDLPALAEVIPGTVLDSYDWDTTEARYYELAATHYPPPDWDALTAEVDAEMDALCDAIRWDVARCGQIRIDLAELGTRMALGQAA